MNRSIEIDARFEWRVSSIPGLVGQPSADPYGGAHAFLARHGVPRGAYVFDIPDCNETSCFHFENDMWVYYYSERGRRTGASLFASWPDAIGSFCYHPAWVYADRDFPRIGEP